MCVFVVHQATCVYLHVFTDIELLFSFRAVFSIVGLLVMIEWSFKSFVCVLFYVSKEYFSILGNKIILFES